MWRICKVVESFVEVADGGGDHIGLDVSGTPDEVAAEIARALKETELYHGDPLRSYLDDDNEDLFMVLRNQDSEGLGEKHARRLPRHGPATDQRGRPVCRRPARAIRTDG